MVVVVVVIIMGDAGAGAACGEAMMTVVGERLEVIELAKEKGMERGMGWPMNR